MNVVQAQGNATYPVEICQPQKGDILEGRIVQVKPEEIIVDIGTKTEGVIPKGEWAAPFIVEKDRKPEIGDKVKVYVLDIGKGDDGLIRLSRWRAVFEEAWDRIRSFQSEDKVLKVKGIKKVKGGLMVDVFGLEGFIPQSHLSLPEKPVSPWKFKGKDIEVKIVEADKKKRRIILSRRAVLEEEFQKEKEKLLSTLKEGDIVEGKVSGITNFGVFVDLGPVEGLIHLSELSWSRDVQPRDVVRKGQKIKAKVIEVKPDEEKVSLSLKQLQPNPWDSIEEKYKVGDICEGKVTRITNFGVFVELEPGVEGLIFLRDLDWVDVENPKKIVREGQKIKVKILNINAAEKKMRLGRKQLLDPWEGIADVFKVGDILKVKVTKLADFGAFVELRPGVEGLIHVSHLTKGRIRHPSECVKEGEELEVKVLEVKPEERRIRLSVKELILEREREERRKKEEEKREQEEKLKESMKEILGEEPSVTMGDIMNWKKLFKK
ncbi:MAG: S1 RNA-binding domain-containing protein [Synergistetes bacterium]|nr:S1 RNA-binding domain-containing protein [Synergistota bacterium]MCX8128232.1 S1 RNA-binding domain-containing protein [Synergistota bacterium]MDW8192679.1 S1 RNA-binding domain-containing protein [Synergistota bacterium]